MFTPSGPGVLGKNQDAGWSGEWSRLTLQPSTPGAPAAPLIGFGLSSTNLNAQGQTPATSDDSTLERAVQRLDDSGFGRATSTERRVSTAANIDRGIVEVFTLEPIRYRHLEMGCSPHTAIVRRNAFCLINWVPVRMSW